MTQRHDFKKPQMRKMPQAGKPATAALIMLVGVVMGCGPAHAGFEWVPPAEVVVPAPQVQPAPVPPQQQQQQQPPAVSPYAGAENFPNPVPPMTPPAANAGQLVINPYPMVPAGYGDVLMGVGPVEQAMMSESRMLNPVQLPGGLNTGSKTRAIAPTYPAAPPTNILPQGLNAADAMSPMPGDTAMAPLPGYEAPPVMAEAVSAPAPGPVTAEPVIQNYPSVQTLTTPPAVAMKAAAKMQAPRPAPQAAPSSPAPAPATAGNFEEAVGFGNDLPLALALSQVIPENYALFFETAVDAEQTSVSWEGGKPWNQVLQDMLAPLGLRAEIQPNLVMIRGA